MKLPYKRKTTNSPPFRLPPIVGEMTLSGENSCAYSPVVPLTQEHNQSQSNFHSIRSLLLNFQAEDGCPPQVHSTYWAIASWGNTINTQKFYNIWHRWEHSCIHIEKCHIHQCQDKPQKYRHWLIRMSRQDSKGPISSSPKDTMLHSSGNPLWSRHAKDSSGKILKLHERERSTFNRRERSPLYERLQKQKDKE